MAIAKGGPQEAARVMTDTFAVAAVRCDREGRFLWVNPTYARWAARAPEKIVGARNAVAILGRKGSQDPEVAWSQGVIERQIEQLSRLIDDLLDIERISRGKFMLRRSPVPLEVAIDMALEASRPQINAAGHHLSVLLPSERVAIDADVARIAQVFSTLLKNAARHMPTRGSIGLTATVETGAVLVRIEDPGVGLAAGRDQGGGLPPVGGIL